MSAASLPAPPLPEPRLALLSQLTEGLETASLWWISGYAAGLARAQPPAPSVRPLVLAAALESGFRPTIVYGSQTGNAHRVAETLQATLESAGIASRLQRADAYPLHELKNERHLLLVISTQGDGDPPDDAQAFVEFLLGPRAPKLPELRFAVFGLGDSSYSRFCEIGRRLDARFEELGASRWLPRVDADLDIDTLAAPWTAQVLERSKEQGPSPQPAIANVTPLRTVPARIDREHPFAAQLLANQRITGRGGYRDIRHIELSLEGSGLDYEPGDALAVHANNPPRLVDAVLETLRLDGDTLVEQGGVELPLRTWLSEKRELTRLSRGFIAAQAARARDAGLLRLLDAEQAESLAALIAQQQPIDLLLRHRTEWTPQDLVATLRPLVPRQYSIASSRKIVGEEAHLTVAHVEYEHEGATRWGVASHHLASRGIGGHASIHLERNERFRQPKDGARDIIMIGPGTGVAPFRGFVQERGAIGATGRNWLFFGAPHARSDFLYQLEWQRALKQGQLHRLDLAFSRDGGDRTYVQQRLRERASELFAWLRDGAHLYVCGSVVMGRDVHASLLELIATQGALSPDAAADFLKQLQQQGRYARDVY
ncbi:assimilatory sulfite reductase (NADPH) flavoprotein subunit [Arenimonas sp.]|uniref:assimilatory sulfite reductase (NADPH) flavoprotein subunit n=1 Tax=Arenimonas sp. TaxID=1872635 RepID=UPI0039E68BD4